jgi:CheY-like chemotaxis protein
MVDDDEDDQLLFREALKQVNKSVTCNTALNGAEALEILQSSVTPDLIFLDLNMPIMNGFDCLKALKNEKIYRHIPVIIFTTANDLTTIEKCRTLGASGFFHKPIDFDLLLLKLQQLLKTDTDSPQSLSVPDFLI